MYTEYMFFQNLPFSLIFINCTHNPDPVVKSPNPNCTSYASNQNIYGYCLYKQVQHIQKIEDVNTHCKHAFDWKSDCTQSWVMSNVDHYSLESLMQVCDHHADCAFELLDAKPNDDVLVQMDLCVQYTPKYRNDCIHHAMQRWYFEWPDATEMKRVASKPSPAPEQTGLYLGARVGCDNVGHCTGLTEVKQICEKYVQEFEDLRKCPNQHRRRKSTKH